MSLNSGWATHYHNGHRDALLVLLDVCHLTQIFLMAEPATMRTFPSHVSAAVQDENYFPDVGFLEIRS